MPPLCRGHKMNGCSVFSQDLSFQKSIYNFAKNRECNVSALKQKVIEIEPGAGYSK